MQGDELFEARPRPVQKIAQTTCYEGVSHKSGYELEINQGLK